jgi:Zn-dependent M28 family amino/carboxypeptidase
MDTKAVRLDRRALMQHIRTLADDEQMQGRGSETQGIVRSRAYLRGVLADIGLEPLFPGYEQPFVFEGTDHLPTQGMNVIGALRGATDPDIYITLSAHYDHLGQERPGRGGTYSGADDNASGVAALIEIARSFAEARPHCTLVFCFFDGEEAGMKGSAAFVTRAPIPLERLALEINVDMIGRADEPLLWVAGARRSTWLRPHLDAIAAAVDIPLVLGHDRFSLRPGDDWTHMSDHGPFHDAGLPWLHFGVSNHDDTHETSDESGRIDTDFLHAAAEAVHVAVRHFDAHGKELINDRNR